MSPAPAPPQKRRPKRTVQKLALSTQEAADRIGISERSLRALIYRGELRSVKAGGRVLIAVRDLQAFIDGSPD